MKDKIFMLIIGLLLGAVIATGAFYVYTTSNKCNCNNQNTGMNGGTPPSMPSGQNNENGQPPEMPNNTDNTTEQNNN